MARTRKSAARNTKRAHKKGQKTNLKGFRLLGVPYRDDETQNKSYFSLKEQAEREQTSSAALARRIIAEYFENNHWSNRGFNASVKKRIQQAE